MKKFAFALFIAASLLASPLTANADSSLRVGPGGAEAVPIAIPEFTSAGGGSDEIGRNMTAVISNDLNKSGLFRVLDEHSYIQPAAQAAMKPNFGEWRSINADALATGLLSRSGDKTRVEFRLWDVAGQSQMVGTAYMTTPTNWRRIAHIIADAIYKRITGENGYFDTRIVYISETGPGNARVKRLAIMDQDGANHRYLTDGSALVLTPRFSPTMQQITYMAYYNNKPRVYIYDINSGRQSVLGDFAGMTFAPRFSPDGHKVIMSLSKGGNSDIYAMTLGSRAIARLTNDASINTAPSYSPDGRRVAFESDRSGKQQIYVMNADGSNQQRISFGDGRYGNPVWSPRGDLIAFIKMQGGRFNLGVIKPDGSGERIISQAYHIEGPTWSPNGRVLSYFKEQAVGDRRTGRSAKIYTIDLTGYHEQMVPTPLDGSDPAWSPLNP